MNSRICILLNKLEEFDFETLLNRYLPRERFKVEITDTFPDRPLDYRLIVPWNYRKIIKQAERFGNVVVMHSSNLPEGRGWAPIYSAFREQKTEYVISGIFAADEVDAGDIIIRARFPLESGHTAPFIREVDNEISLVLIAKILEKWPGGTIKAIKQSGAGSYRARRLTQDNEVDINKTLEDLLPHLRGVESNNPAFFYFNGLKYLIEVRPELEPVFPKQVTIEYPGLNETEIWAGRT
jgi:methionyl-tRNA formyltransferase